MQSSVIASETTEAGVLSDRPQSRSALSFAVGFGLASLLTAVAIIALLLGQGLAGHTTTFVAGALLTSLAISAVLLGIVSFRLVRVARAWRASATGARLHTRFVVLFSLAALTPAVIVAAFLGFTFTQGVENWFSERVQNTVENAAHVGRDFVDLASNNIADQVQAMAKDLNQARRGITDDPHKYATYFQVQAESRHFSSAYIFDRSGHVLVRAQQQGAAGFAAPSAEALRTADHGDVYLRFDQQNDRLVAVYPLSGYGNAYLLVSSALRPGLVARLRSFDQSVDDYRKARERQGTLGILFGLAYLSTTVLVLLGAIWVGLSSASRVAEPIGRLVNAARRVAAGDLKARVAVGEERDEVDALGVAFNRMTAQLETQRRDLMSAQEDAETRSRFIETVIGGVSAGVISIDRDGRITVTNRSAAQLLGHQSGDLVARRLIDVAPEFADLLNQPAPQAETAPQRVDLMRDDGVINLSVRMAPDTEGGLVLTFDDMTKLISAQRQEAWKDVARRIAHEIKNPLTPIQLSAERLKKKYSGEIGSDPETFQRCTDTILRQVADIGRMVDEFSAFARMPTPIMSYSQMNEVAQSVVFGQRLVFADIRFEAEGVDRPIALVCDERLIGQALTNLVKNAAESVQARRARDGEPKDGFVILRLRDLETGVQFEVTDNGLGFPEKNRHRLIEPYVTTRTKGTGLGLAIVARIVEDHGGLIELGDAPGQSPGAVVRFVLPKRSLDVTESVAEHGVGAS
jgi:two-component system nitrogen regulation sensor histidine kinase NtrY